MSSEDKYMNDYKRFKRGRSNNFNDFSNKKAPLHSSDLRNKINNKNTKSSRDSEWEKRQNEIKELNWTKREQANLEWRKSNNNAETKVIEESTDLELYKEYVQWDFINNCLYNEGEKLMQIGGRGKQEFTNTLQRWFIYINEDFNNVPKLNYFPILPDINLQHEASQFLRSAFIEKEFVTEYEADEATENLLKIISSNHNKVPPHNAVDPLYVEYNHARNVIVVNKFQSPEVPRVKLLVTKGGIIATARMLLRYESFGNGSYQWGDPTEVHKVLYDRYRVRYEGFASPVNSRFIEYDDTHFCSLFPETDSVFGSLGNFFHVDMEKHSGGWSVNPPFLNDLMKNVADHIIKILDHNPRCYFFCTFPCWEDDDGWNTLNNSKHLLRRFNLKAQHFIVQDAYGNQFYPKMGMNLFVMGELPPDCIKLTELGNKLIHDSINSLPDDCPW